MQTDNTIIKSGNKPGAASEVGQSIENNSDASCADTYDPESLTAQAARERILAGIKPIIGKEKLPLRSTLGRVLADDIISPFNVPNHANSAMDGYALKAVDLNANELRDFDVIATVYAGDQFGDECQTGQCIRIMTGAPIPAGTDTIIMQEQIEQISDGRIRVSSAYIYKAGQNLRQVGEDIAKDSVVLKAGRRIIPADLGVLASLGIGEVQVRRRPRVAFFSTGDELCAIGEVLEQGKIYDSNRYSLHGMLTRLNVDILDLGVIKDQPEAIRETFQTASTIADVVISSGGVSVGDADYIKPLLRELGDIHFWKIAIKPGRPLTFGHLFGHLSGHSGNALFFGLPGNPVAVMVTFYQFVQPALCKLTGAEFHPPLTVKATSMTAIRKRPGRFEFQRGIMSQTRPGEFEVQLAGKQGSGILTSMSRANCFILLPDESSDIQKGDGVIVQPFATFI